MVSQNHHVMTAPRFQITAEQPMRPEIIAYASVVMLTVLAIFLYAARLPAHLTQKDESLAIERSATSGQAKGGGAGGDDSSALDTLVFGDPGDPQHKVVRSSYTQVHPTLVGHFQRFGEGPGLLPDTPAGHLLYTWLVAFNRSDLRAMSDLLPPGTSSLTMEQLLELRSRSGGFDVVAVKAAGPGTLSFVLREETSPNSIFSGRLAVPSASSVSAIRSFALHGAVVGTEFKR